MHMYLDIIGSCNLKCPSCPMGNSLNKNNNKAMTLELLRSIAEKASNEGIASIYLFNWTEPLIHPKIGEFISEIEGRGIACGISSNLNISKNLESALRAGPSFFRISLSGFYQETYARGHAGGEIAAVKRNMELAADFRRKFNSKTHIQVYYHRYLDNSDEELLMREFAESLGFDFRAEFAYMMPLEKLFKACEPGFSFSGNDAAIISRIALPPSKEVFEIAKRYKAFDCSLRESQLTLDCEGNVILCCSVFEQNNNLVGKYTEIPLDKIQQIKNNRDDLVGRCKKCMDNGLHVYVQFPGYGELGEFSIERLLERKANQVGVSVFSRKNEDLFDEAEYLLNNPDVHAAVGNGIFKSGYEHYVKFGMSEIAAGSRTPLKKGT